MARSVNPEGRTFSAPSIGHSSLRHADRKRQVRLTTENRPGYSRVLYLCTKGLMADCWPRSVPRCGQPRALDDVSYTQVPQAVPRSSCPSCLSPRPLTV
ncbi:hypothetical protein FKP32DRAFT_884516 [Trametes sanguinea]|nr:hypothetical protein FKP32DRAFT_884516 [Trametes sanguinea]